MNEKTGYKYRQLVKSNSKPVKNINKKNTGIPNQQHNNQTRKRHIHGNNKHKHDKYSLEVLF
jgi:hypothetical protein